MKIVLAIIIILVLIFGVYCMYRYLTHPGGKGRCWNLISFNYLAGCILTVAALVLAFEHRFCMDFTSILFMALVTAYIGATLVLCLGPSDDQ